MNYLKNDGKIHISLASDAGNVQAMATVIASALHNKNADNFYVFHLLLAGEADDDLQEKLKKCTIGFEDSCQINFIYLKDKFSNINLGNYITYAAYFRMMLPSLLPDLEKIIYIDTDTLVRQDLRELWNFDIGENYIAGVPNYYGGIIQRKKYKLSGFLSTDFYINSGVMLMNLKEWRASGIEQKCLAKIGDRDLCKIETGDQVILNFVCYPKIAFLPCKWNVTESKVRSHNGYIRRYDIFYSSGELSEALNNPAVFHWTGSQKPWKYYDVPLAHEWFRYYLKTSPSGEPLQRESSLKGRIKNLVRLIIGLWRDGRVY
jgi:lipopolysaccharide biosynthesis glycosyltransferase